MEKDHHESLLEDIRGKFELVLEGHESLNRKSSRNELESFLTDLAITAFQMYVPFDGGESVCDNGLKEKVMRGTVNSLDEFDIVIDTVNNNLRRIFGVTMQPAEFDVRTLDGKEASDTMH